MNMGYRQLSVLLFPFVCQIAFSSSIPHLCPKHQSISLLKFKNKLTIDPSNDNSMYRSWNMSNDCCLWKGVKCDKMTGHVIELDLSESGLVGKIHSNSTLFRLSHLQRLNFSGNDFSNSHISPKFGRFSSLTHLDLSYSSFSGQIPSEISHLSKLHSLLLSDNHMLTLGPHNFNSLLQNLTQLRVLNLNDVNISSTIPPNFSSHITTLGLDNTKLHGILPESIFHLPNLQVLDLADNDQLSGSFPKNKWNSSASIREMHLYEVNFSGNLPESIGYLTSLHHLSLRSCNLSGPIPKSLWNLTRIEYLYLLDNHLEGPIPLFASGLQNLNTLMLSNNFLNGKIPSWIFSLPSLSTLELQINHFTGQLEDFKYNSTLLDRIDLRDNQLQGHLPRSLQNLVNLTYLDLSSNNFSGPVDISFFSNLTNLWALYLSYNNITLTNKDKVKSTWPESLELLGLASCEVKDLELLRSAKDLEELDLSNNKIQGKIPEWAWSNWNFSLNSLDLSHNLLTTVDSIPLRYIHIIDLRSNLLQGPLPIPPNSIAIFFISENNLTEEIPSSICNLTSLYILDLARNNLRGAIPQCLGSISGLQVLDMHRNNLSGTLPTNFGIGSSLRSLNFHGNELEGKIPRSLAKCKELQVLDLGGNHLNDTFPMWLGALPKLQVLSLRSNKLYGPIRTSSIKKPFPQLRMLDLSFNVFTANLPTSLFQNLEAMRSIDQSTNIPSYLGLEDGYYQDSVTVATKGLELELVRILTVYTAIDLSSNKFEGHIPSIMGDLIALRVLNLSHNDLQGHIPPSLGNLSLVESLDLSVNQLAGEIPQQLASLTSLAVLNLSHNHLKGPQFATFQSNSYEGNDGLRGFPVSKGCGNDGIIDTNYTTTSFLDQESNSQFLPEFWKAALMGYGTGLCIGLSIIYFMISTRNPIWLARIIVELEHKMEMRRWKKRRGQRDHRRRNNRL